MSDLYFLGVDGGATRSGAVVMDKKGKILGRGKGGALNYRAVGLLNLEKNLRQVILETSRKAKVKPFFSFAVLGLAACDSTTDQGILETTIGKKFSRYFSSFQVINDTRIALRSGTEEPFGVAVISGTGSNMYGKNREGKEALASGLGPLLSDEGSAYEIGFKVLRAALRSSDGRGRKTILEEMVKEKLQVPSMREATGKVYKPSFNKAKVASFAPLAGKAARLGDKEAKAILLLAADELFLGVKAVVERLGMKKEKFDLVLVGSVFKNKIVLEEFQKKVKNFIPGARLAFPKVAPAYAAALLALKEYVKMEKED